MAITEQEFKQAQARSAALRHAGYAVAVCYDSRAERVIIGLSNDVQIAVPVRLTEGLAGASVDALSKIEISPSGLGLHWPKLDADLYVPAVLQGAFGSKNWMAAQLGKSGGKATTAAKAAASRENGRKGGRPRRSASNG